MCCVVMKDCFSLIKQLKLIKCSGKVSGYHERVAIIGVISMDLCLCITAESTPGLKRLDMFLV